MSVAGWLGYREHKTGFEERQNRRVGYAGCTCGWGVARETEEEARAMATAHALTHRPRAVIVRGSLLPARAWHSGEGG